MSPLSTASLPSSYAGALVMSDLVCLSGTEEERESFFFFVCFYIAYYYFNNVCVLWRLLFFFHAQLQIVQKIPSYTKNPVVLPCFLMVFRALLTLLWKIYSSAEITLPDVNVLDNTEYSPYTLLQIYVKFSIDNRSYILYSKQCFDLPEENQWPLYNCVFFIFFL